MKLHPRYCMKILFIFLLALLIVRARVEQLTSKSLSVDVILSLGSKRETYSATPALSNS